MEMPLFIVSETLLSTIKLHKFLEGFCPQTDTSSLSPLFLFIYFFSLSSSKMDVEEKGNADGKQDYTQDGTVDLKGRPVLRSKTGKWRACSFIVGKQHHVNTV